MPEHQGLRLGDVTRQICQDSCRPNQCRVAKTEDFHNLSHYVRDEDITL